MSEVIKDRILKTAILMFSQNGFHGTTMRDIAKTAECSLPMMYYYYQNKETLFEEIAVNQFFKLLKELYSKIDFTLPPDELYTTIIMQRKNVDEYEKGILRVATKLWYGFEGTPQQRMKIMNWERNRVKENRKLIDKYVIKEEDRQLFAEVFVSFLENQINKVTFFDVEVTEDELKKQIKFLFQLINKD